MKCPNCKKNPAKISPVYGVMHCDECQVQENTAFANPDVISLSKLHRIQQQRDSHVKDLLQPFNGNKVNPEFFKAYPKQVKRYNVKRELEKL